MSFQKALELRGELEDDIFNVIDKYRTDVGGLMTAGDIIVVLEYAKHQLMLESMGDSLLNYTYMNNS